MVAWVERHNQQKSMSTDGHTGVTRERPRAPTMLLGPLQGILWNSTSDREQLATVCGVSRGRGAPFAVETLKATFLDRFNKFCASNELDPIDDAFDNSLVTVSPFDGCNGGGEVDATDVVVRSVRLPHHEDYCEFSFRPASTTPRRPADFGCTSRPASQTRSGLHGDSLLQLSNLQSTQSFTLRALDVLNILGNQDKKLQKLLGLPPLNTPTCVGCGAADARPVEISVGAIVLRGNFLLGGRAMVPCARVTPNDGGERFVLYFWMHHVVTDDIVKIPLLEPVRNIIRGQQNVKHIEVCLFSWLMDAEKLYNVRKRTNSGSKKHARDASSPGPFDAHKGPALVARGTTNFRRTCALSWALMPPTSDSVR